MGVRVPHPAQREKMRSVILILTLLATACGAPAPKIEMQPSPFLLSVLGLSVSLAPNTNPRIDIDIGGNTQFHTEHFTLQVIVYRGELEILQLVTNEPYMIIPVNTEIPPYGQINEIRDVYGFFTFSRIQVFLEKVKFREMDEIVCDPDIHDCWGIEAEL